MPDPKKQLTPEIRLEKYEMEVPMNSRNTAHLNPVVYAAFKKTTLTPKEHVTFYFLDDNDTELGIFWADPGPGAAKLTESKSEGTANFTLGLLVAKYPALKVERGRVRPFPAAIIPHEDGQCLLVLVHNIDSVPGRTYRKPKPGSQPASGDQSPS
jgi:hypothetical protein